MVIVGEGAGGDALHFYGLRTAAGQVSSAQLLSVVLSCIFVEAG